MIDDGRAPRIPDTFRIDLSEPDVTQAWCRRLVCTEAELHAAVETVGAGAAKVMAYLDALRWNAKRRGPMLSLPPWMACDSPGPPVTGTQAAAP